VGSFVSTTEGAGGYVFTHYASPTGVATYANATNINTPCNIHTAFASATAGDVVGLRGGTYNIGSGTGESNPALPLNGTGTVTQPLVFAAYTGESPILDGTGTTLVNGASTVQGCIVLSLNDNKTYITFDGLKFTCDGGLHAPFAFRFGGSGNQGDPPSTYDGTMSNHTIKNCEFNGGSVLQTYADNSAAIRFNGCRHVTVENCYFYNWLNAGPNDYPEGIQSYSGHDIIVRNNHFHECHNGVYLKSYNSDWDIYNNFFTDYQNRALRASCETHYIHKIRVYNNVAYHSSPVTNTTLGAFTLATNNTPGGVPNFLTSQQGIECYNNTAVAFTSNLAGAQFSFQNILAQTDGFKFYNNLIIGRDNLTGSGFGFQSGQLNIARNENYTAAVGEVDYNLYDTATFRVMGGNGGGNLLALDLATLQGLTIHGLSPGQHNQNSVEGTPVFVNSSGTFSVPSDFQLAAGSPGKGVGRFGDDMGANVATVGIGNG
jgi:hypothetical protein